MNVVSPTALNLDESDHFLMTYTTDKISNELLQELAQSIKNIRGWGSVEIFVQNFRITQITEKNIKKTFENINGRANGQE